MIDNDTIYILASRDARTGNIPSRTDEGEFTPNDGMNEILIDDDNSYIKDVSRKISTLENTRKSKIDEMSHQQNLFEKSRKDDAYYESQKRELDEKNNDYLLTEDKIKQESNRLSNRGHNPPTEASFFNTKTESKSENDSSKKFRTVKPINWNPIKKWIIVFFTAGGIEAFFGLAMWDSLRDQKSITEVILRIVATAAIVFTLHLAESKLKKLKKRVYAVYIVYGILTLLILLIGSLILGYYFPEYIEPSTALANDAFNLNSFTDTPNYEAPRDLIGLFLKYDYVLGLLAVIIYLLIFFLEDDIPKLINTQGDLNQSEANVKLNKNLKVFNSLENMYLKKRVLHGEIRVLKNEIQFLESKPSRLSLEILDFLKERQKEIQAIDEELSKLKIQQEKILDRLMSQLMRYETDYLDVFKENPIFSIVTPDWPKEADVLRYYNIN